MITLDGSYGEGGGALVRTALALSTLTGKSFTVNNIRAGRPKPGLKAQHLTAINALKQICKAETNEVLLGTTELTFKPGKIKSGRYDIDIGTAGSITLLLQSLILPAMFAPGPITLTVIGGTCGKWQASVDYLQNILSPILQRFAKIELKILKRGYYPKGGGKIELKIRPILNLQEASFWEELQLKFPKFNLQSSGDLQQIRGVVNVSEELAEKEVGERISLAAERFLKKYEVPVNIRVEYAKALSIGGEVILWSVNGDSYENGRKAGDALVEPRKSSEQIGKEAAEELSNQIDQNFGIDKFAADMLIHFMALLPGSIITSEISNHLKTNIYVTEKFLPVGFKIEKNSVSISSL